MTEALIRPVDAMGRVVLPLDFRQALHIWVGDMVAVSMDGDQIRISKHAPECTFCGSADGLREFRGKLVCSSCLRALQRTEAKRTYIPFDQCT